MTDRPILFSAPMVRALLDGRKTQTRRVLSRARVFATTESPAFTLKRDHLKRALQGASGFRHLLEDGWFWEADAFEWQAPAERTGWMAHIGYAVGDRLWVKETWAKADPYGVRYYATDHVHELRKKQPSIFMPRWASRITLTVTDVRVQRLQECSEQDAIAEGVEQHQGSDGPVAEYEALWDTINGPGSWHANPWIVALTFGVEHRNIDQAAA